MRLCIDKACTVGIIFQCTLDSYCAASGSAFQSVGPAATPATLSTPAPPLATAPGSPEVTGPAPAVAFGPTQVVPNNAAAPPALAPSPAAAASSTKPLAFFPLSGEEHPWERVGVHRAPDCPSASTWCPCICPMPARSYVSSPTTLTHLVPNTLVRRILFQVIHWIQTSPSAHQFSEERPRAEHSSYLMRPMETRSSTATGWAAPAHLFPL
jgi:hypothetical protein